MSKEIKNTDDALLLRLGQMVKENVELEQRVHQLTDDFNEVARQLQGQEKRKGEDHDKQMIEQISKMRDVCNHFELENIQLNEYAKVVDSFIKDKKIYMPKGIQCPYRQDNPGVASTTCLECNSCLRVLEGFGVVCQVLLENVKIGFTKPCPPEESNS